jgi:uncharacterized RDD family membrane protein YckC
VFCSRCGTWAADDATLCTLCGAALQDDNLPRVVRTATEPPFRMGAVAGETASVMPIVSYGGFWRRLVAVLLDSILLWFPSATIRVVLGLDPFGVFDPQSPTAWIAACAEYALGGAYAVLLIRSSMRGTLGLQVMDLQVTDLHGGRVSFLRAAWRYLAQLLTLVTFGVGYLLQLVTPRRQTLHDMVSGTVVVRARPAPAPAAPRPAMLQITP